MRACLDVVSQSLVDLGPVSSLQIGAAKVDNHRKCRLELSDNVFELGHHRIALQRSVRLNR